MKTISRTQQEIFEYIKEQFNIRGIAPSVREIADAVGLRSTSSVQYNLDALERAGYIERDPNLNRTIRISSDKSRVSIVPLIEKYNENKAVLSYNQFSGFHYANLEADSNHIAFKVKDNLMEKAHILKGDVVIAKVNEEVKNNDLVLANVSGVLKVKKVKFIDNDIRLQSENENKREVVIDDFEIIGKVVSLNRERV